MRLTFLALASLAAVGCRVHYDPLEDAAVDARGADSGADPSTDSGDGADGGLDGGALDGGAPPGCGDGVIDPLEECDDGDTDDTDACLGSCRLARCGDGVVRGGVEDCDDGNLEDDDGCTSACVRCPSGADATFVWPGNHHCYTWHDVTEPWPSVRESCHGVVGGGFSLGYGAHAATFATAEENDAVTAALGATRTAWLGLHAFAPRTELAWDDGPLTYSRWAAGEPLLPTGNAAVVRPDGTWATAAPSTQHGRLCEHEPGWLVRASDGHAYAYFGDRALTRALADARCASFGGHVLVLDDAAEQLFVTSIALPFRTWLGLSDAGVEGTFEWVTGAPLDYTFWSPGEPVVGTGARCVATADQLGRWSVLPCDDEYDYICELE